MRLQEPAYDLALQSAVLIRSGEFDESLKVLDRCLQIWPAFSTALALRAFVLSELGMRAQLHTLLDFDRFVAITTPSAPALYSLKDFCRFLAQEVLSDPSLSEKKFTPLPSGRSTADLATHAGTAIQELMKVIKNEVKTYRLRVIKGAPHPFLQTNPATVMWLTIWGNVLEAGEALGSHYHPNSWLSGVYYAQLPKEGGEIEFFESIPDLGRYKSLKPRTLSVEEGMLLLFPSFFSHRTRNFGGTEQRISIAFELGFPR